MSPSQRDRDRILYTSAFQRLAEVTQVLSPDEGHVFHNRLTHSLKVAQVARRVTELVKDSSEGAKVQGLNIDPDVAEAAALTHDPADTLHSVTSQNKSSTVSWWNNPRCREALTGTRNRFG